MHDGIQVTLHTATIKPTPTKCHSFNRIIGGLGVDCICELNFTTRACGLIAQNIKDVWGQNIAANAGKV